MVGYLAEPHTMTLDSKTAGGMLKGIGFEIFGILALPFAMLVVVGVGAHWMQHAPVFSTEKLKPDISRINPMKGFSKLFGRAALVNFVKGLLKTGFVAAAIWAVLWPSRDQILAVVTLPVGLLLPFVQGLTMQILYATLAVLGVIAVADYGWQYFERMRRLKATRSSKDACGRSVRTGRAGA
jgi:flagellar biosynthetic protein FlhB